MKKLISLIILSLCTIRITICMEQRDKNLKEELLFEIKKFPPSIQRVKSLLHYQALTQGSTDEFPLLVAARWGHHEICQLLIDAGANIQVKDDYGSLVCNLLSYVDEREESHNTCNTNAYLLIKALLSRGYIVEPEDLYQCAELEDLYGFFPLILQAIKERIALGQLPQPPRQIFQTALSRSVNPKYEHRGNSETRDLLLDNGAEILDYTMDRDSYDFIHIVLQIINGNACGDTFDHDYMEHLLARSLGRPPLTASGEQASAIIIATLILMKRKGISKDVAYYILHLAQEDLINFFAPLVMNNTSKKIPEVFVPLLHTAFYEATLNELKFVITRIMNDTDVERCYFDDRAHELFAPEVLEETIGSSLKKNILTRLKNQPNANPPY